MIKSYDELNFTDDFMFCKVLSTNSDICIGNIELILNIKVKSLRFVEPQKSIDMTADGRGIRLDIYVEDEYNTVYDIEMQTTDKKDLGRRSRYYQGVIDLNLLEKGCPFSELKRSYIIFICLNDPFSADLPVYTFNSVCIENNNIFLDDFTTKVFVNGACDRTDINNDLKFFIDYLKGKEPLDFLTQSIDNNVKKAREHKEWRSEYMTLNVRFREFLEEGRQEGLQEGRQEGLQQGLAEGACNKIFELVKEGFLSPEVGAENLGISIEELNEKVSKYQKV